MGLDTTHGCFHGAYSSFNDWREVIAEQVGITLRDMKGFGGSIPWSEAGASPLNRLLQHSDCDGSILWQHCSAIADALEALLPQLEQRTKLASGFFLASIDHQIAVRLIAGLRLAASRQEDVEFH